MTSWLIKDSIRVQSAANRDLISPEIATALQECWDDHLWHEEIRYLVDSDEMERMARDEAPIDPALEDSTCHGPDEDPFDDDPPY